MNGELQTRVLIETKDGATLVWLGEVLVADSGEVLEYSTSVPLYSSSTQGLFDLYNGVLEAFLKAPITVDDTMLAKG